MGNTPPPNDDAPRPSGHGASPVTRAPLRLNYVCGLRTLLTLYDLELHAVAFGQGFEPVALDRAEVDEDVRPSLTGAEPETLRVVEPLHSAVETCHEPLPLLPLPGLTVTLEPSPPYIQAKRRAQKSCRKGRVDQAAPAI